MASGTPLTPEQLKLASEVYEKTANYSEAARAIDADISAVRRALLRLEKPNRAKLNARAVERGVREGRKKLRSIIALSGDLLATKDGKPFKMNGKEFASIASAIARATEVLNTLSERKQRNQQLRLQREKIRAEIELLRARTRGDVHDTVILTPADKAYEELMLEKWGAKRQGTASSASRETNTKPDK